MIYIVLPAYNEEEGLPRLLDAIRLSLAGATLEFTAIVVDDGSTDATEEAARRAGGDMPVEVLKHQGNRGLSEAIKTGLMRASDLSSAGDIIVTMDADNTHAPDLIVRMVGMIREGYDVAIASRYVPGARVVGVPLSRRFLSYSASLLLRALFPISGVKDYTSGYRAYRAELVGGMFSKYGEEFIDEPGFSCMVDILLKMRRESAKMGEVPLILRYDLKAGASKMDVGRTIMDTLALLWKHLLGGR